MGIFVPRTRSGEVHRGKRPLAGVLSLRSMSNVLCRLLAPAIIIFSLTPSAEAQKRKGAPRPQGRVDVISALVAATPEARRRLETFELVWTTLQNNYFDPTFSDLDWNKIKGEFGPRAAKARSDAELHRLLGEMIGRLQRSHLGIITPEVFQAIERAKVEAKAREAAIVPHEAMDGSAGTGESDEDGAGEYGIGVDLRILDGRFVVSRVDPKGSAAEAGIRPGFVIERINGVSLSELLRRIDLQPATSAKVKKYLSFEIVGAFLNGDRDTPVAVTYLDGTDSVKEVVVARKKIASETITLGANYPDRQLNFEAYSISDDVGYIRFNFFAMPVVEKFCAAVRQFKTKKALIIDLRGNLGGILASLVGIGGMLAQEPIDLGTSIYRNGSENLVADTKRNNFKGKVVFVVDRQTVSAAEIFAASLQDAGRAVVVGDTTAGEALPSISLRLPTGAVLQYPIANYRSLSGRYLEGNGVTPDVVVPLDRRALLQGSDPQLVAALRALENAVPQKRVKPAAETKLAIAPSSDVPRPPAPPKAAVRITGDTNVPAPPPPATRLTPPSSLPSKDAQSLAILDEFVKKMGGAEKIRAIKSYKLSGTTEVLVKGSTNRFELDVFYSKPGNYAEILRSPAAGEVREVHSGTTHFVQTDYGLVRELPSFANTADLDILSPVRSAADPDFYKGLKFAGTFDREGRKTHVIDGRTRDGYYLAMAFDVETKLLVSMTGSYYALNFSDYRKAGDLLLPYKIERERVMNITLDEILVNVPIDQKYFSKKENCYDRVD